MGRKAMRFDVLLNLEGSYPIPDIYEGGTISPAHHELSNTNIRSSSLRHRDESTGLVRSAGCRLPADRESRFVCEFRDYCNHLYVIDGTCDCASTWRRKPGFALPASA